VLGQVSPFDSTMNGPTVRIQSQSVPASNQNAAYQVKEEKKHVKETWPMSTNNQDLSDGPSERNLSYDLALSTNDSFVGVQPDQSFEFVFDCVMSRNVCVDDDIDNDSIEIARKQRSVNRPMKKRRATSENAKKQLRALETEIKAYEKTGAPIMSQRHLKGIVSLAMGMRVSLYST
jgi:hypothetical protein